MGNKFFVPIIFCLLVLLLKTANSYSAREDAKIIREYLNKPKPPTDHAKVARTLVHKSNWAATGTISTNTKVQGFPMVNIISIADSAKNSPSTGNIYFLLTMLDFTGQDIKVCIYSIRWKHTLRILEHFSIIHYVSHNIFFFSLL